MELDHLFICVGPGALAAEALRAFGLTEGSPNRHPWPGNDQSLFFLPQRFFRNCSSSLMTLVFDGAPGGRSKDFRPELPLAIRW